MWASSVFGAQEMLDPLSPDLKPVSELLHLLHKRPSPPTVWRWITKGRNGTRLETLKIANRVYSTEDEFRRFLTESQENIPVTSAQSLTSERELARRGYLND